MLQCLFFVLIPKLNSLFMRKSYRFLAVWLMACICSITGFSQPVSVSGNVRDNTSQESIPAVTVIVKGSDLGTFTDENEISK